MANKDLFSTRAPVLSGTVNSAGGRAYAFTDEHALAQLALTGCMNSTFYTHAEDQLDALLRLTRTCDPRFVARTALYARRRGFMKDTPAILAATLSSSAPELLDRVFERVIDNGRMLRNFVQVMRSGRAGRCSLGSGPKRLIRRWLAGRSDEVLFRSSIGRSPSLADVIRMVHPRPATPAREALYGYLLGRDYRREALPKLVRQYDNFKRGHRQEIPDVPFQMLTALDLDRKHWCRIADNAPWQTTRMNLNTFARHGVLRDTQRVATIAARLRDPEAIARARVFPFQLMSAYLAAGDAIPFAIRDALQDALEFAVRNVPTLPGNVFVCPDISGSMHAPISGARGSASSKVRSIDVAALLAAAILRKNRHAEVLPFSDNVTAVTLNPRDTVLTNAARLAHLPSGGTDCSAPLHHLNQRGARGDLVVFVSDNESWIDSPGRWYGGDRTAMEREWNAFKRRNPRARLACIDIQPNTTTQVRERPDVLNIGGFSDQVFELLSTFARGQLSAGRLVKEIRKERL